MFIFCTIPDERVKNKNAQVEALIKKIALDDVGAVGDLYDLIKTDVYAFALSKLLSKTDAEDVMQETFVRVYKYAKQYSPCGKPMAWIMTIELNLIRRHFQLASRTTLLDGGVYSLQSLGKSESDSINSLFVQQILTMLQEEEREIVVLHVISGLKHREIAKILGKPLSTVLSKYNRALKKLKERAKEV